MKVSDFVIRFLKSQGIDCAFLLSGGGMMHLVESLGNSGMEYVCCHHEQACAIAAAAYSMKKNALSLCMVTTGPGGVNALTGVAAAYMDSTPVFFLSGQVKRADFASLRGVRQFGAQENDIVSMVRPVTKYAAVVTEPDDILYHLQKAVHFALSKRRGPVWLDIPLDVQSALIDEDRLCPFDPTEEGEEGAPDAGREAALKEAVRMSAGLLENARRPVFLLGHGIGASESEAAFRKLNERLQVPVLATWRALHVYESGHPLFFGSPGLQAPRYANLILQGADLVIVLGSRLDNMITAFNEGHFAFRAKKIVVDIDGNEVRKLKMPDLFPVEADVRRYLELLLEQSGGISLQDMGPWRDWCGWVRQEYPLWKEKQPCEAAGTDLYRATDAISRLAQKEDTVVVSSTSRCNTAGHMAFCHKEGQAVISSMGMGSMGFALPSAIGAYFASGRKRIVMIEGDGSFQLNIQELQTVCQYGVNVKMFLFCNGGYAAIASMQERNFAGHYVACNPQSGVSMPDLKRIADAYHIPFYRIDSDDEAEGTVREAFARDGAVICEICGSMQFDEIPKCISRETEQGERVSAFLENPYPFLEEGELERIYRQMERTCKGE